MANVEDGLLLAYGPSLDDLFYRAGGYVARILNGARPAELPIAQPEKFELVINTKSAGQLGLSIPQAVLAQATELIS